MLKDHCWQHCTLMNKTIWTKQKENPTYWHLGACASIATLFGLTAPVSHFWILLWTRWDWRQFWSSVRKRSKSKAIIWQNVTPRRYPVNTWGHKSITAMSQTSHTMMPSLWYHIDVTRTSHCEASHHDNTVTSHEFTHISKGCTINMWVSKLKQ